MASILFVHDGESGSESLLAGLADAGHRVVLCERAAGVPRAIEEEAPDLVLLRLPLRGQDGFQLCRALRTRFSGETLPVLAISAILRHPIHRSEAEAAGAQGFFLEPLRLDALLERIEELAATGAGCGTTAS